MTYTENELEKLCENITAIRDFLKTLSPKIGGNFSIKFQYDDCVCYLGIYPNMTNPIDGGMGYSDIPWETEGQVNARKNTTYFVGVLENWQTIKSEFLQEIERRDNLRNKIFNFKI